ncbi:MAG: 2-thiouracil desulfurase family protein [Bradymonadia bacterium]
MKLPHNRERVAALRTPTVEDPWRILMSGCLFGLPCGVYGDDYGLSGHQPTWLTDQRVSLIPFCPEAYEMGVPRGMPDLHGGDGEAVLDGTARMLDEHGNDLTDQMIAGAEAMVAVAKAHQVDFALLIDRSGACGSQVISIGCRFEEPVVYQKGSGVAAALLLRNGIDVVSQRDFYTLGLLGARLDPSYGPAPEAKDHHEHPWVLANLP